MPYDIFSKRDQKNPDVYRYDALPRELRVQIVYILRGFLGLQNRFSDGHNWTRSLRDVLRREYGTFELVSGGDRMDPTDEIEDFILNSGNINRALDAVELAFRVGVNNYDDVKRYSRQEPNEAISELNQRFKEHGIGFQYENEKILKMSSELIHSEVVVPTLRLLNDPRFNNACDEYMSAHDHYRHKRFDECLNECLKGFESTLKIICDIKQWSYDKDKATAKTLIDICITNGLYHSFQQSSLANYRSFLESCVPTARNRVSGHGSGSSPVVVTDAFVEYILHQTALIIRYSIQCL